MHTHSISPTVSKVRITFSSAWFIPKSRNTETLLCGNMMRIIMSSKITVNMMHGKEQVTYYLGCMTDWRWPLTLSQGWPLMRTEQSMEWMEKV